MRNIWLDGMMGLVVGDALGLPVQFSTREELKCRPEGPVCGMEEHGTFDLPAGTWSDDSSLALATLSSLIHCGKAVPEDIMEQFVRWYDKGEYTPFGFAFDQGNTCSNAICRYKRYEDIRSCGGTGEYANGNGALMRILPTCLYYYEQVKGVGVFQSTGCTEEEALEHIHTISALTHNHLRSNICSGMYYFLVKNIIDGLTFNPAATLPELLQCGMDEGQNYYKSDLRNLTELAYLGRIFNIAELIALPETAIKSSGYVIDAIEAAVWCLATTGSYSECVLKAVNLGEDTDTVAAIAGGLAGLYYGYDNIPKGWRNKIRRREWIEVLCEQAERGGYTNPGPVVDMHMHCIPDVDDGAEDYEMALTMLRASYEQGVRRVFCTSHDSAYDLDAATTLERYAELQCLCREAFPELKLYLGCEIYCEPDCMDAILADLEAKRLPSLNDTRYVLTEYGTSGIDETDIAECVDRFLAAGYIPVIAHAERYHRVIHSVETLRKLKEAGALLQVNAYSFLEESNYKTRTLANRLLEEKLIDFIGTDAHTLSHRPPRIDIGVHTIYNRCDREYADAICYKNAEALLLSATNGCGFSGPKGAGTGC